MTFSHWLLLFFIPALEEIFDLSSLCSIKKFDTFEIFICFISSTGDHFECSKENKRHRHSNQVCFQMLLWFQFFSCYFRSVIYVL